MFNRLAHSIDALNKRLGQAISWLTLLMVLVMFVSVIQRYVFEANVIWQAELARYCYGIVFPVASAYTFQHNGHVRIDIIYQRLSDSLKAWVEILGTICFLIPTSIALIYMSWNFVLDSWAIHEKSPEYGGLPGVFLFKTCIWIFAATLALQGLSVVIKYCTLLSQRK